MRTTIASILVTLVAFTYCASRIWHQTPDPTIDFGREVYVAWRIAEGEPLYTHLTYINGRLSPHVNALLFRITGPSLHAIKWFNCLQALGGLAMLYLIFRKIGGDLVAMACCVTWCILFGFAILLNDPTFNFLTPYSHDLTHGFLLALGMILLLSRAIERAWTVGWGLAGLTFGLILLTKPEVILASAAVLGVAVICGRQNLSRRSVIFLCAGLLLPPVIAWILLALKIGGSAAAWGMLGGFRWLTDQRLTELPLYRWLNGTDQPRANLIILLKWSGVWAGAAGLLTGLSWVLRNQKFETLRFIAIALGALVFGGLYRWQGDIAWPSIFRGLPLLLLVMIAVAWKLLPSPRQALIFMMLVFSLVLIAKIGLAVRITHYGFVLAAPGTLILLALLLGPLADRLGSGGWILRGGIVGVLCMVIWMYLQATDVWATKRMGARLDTPADGYFNADPQRADAITKALNFASSQIKPGETLACVPDGTLINFLLRRVNPTGHSVLLPGEMIMFGEQRITDDFANAPPDWIFVSHRDLAMQNAHAFGDDFARPLASWIAQNYTPVQGWGEKPFTTSRYGILLLRRNDLR